MQIPLTPELERVIQEKVSSGRYASAIDVNGDDVFAGLETEIQQVEEVLSGV